MKLKLLLISIIIFAFYACAPKQAPKEEPVVKHPNIIYVLADDLGIGDVNTFNPDGKILTPHLDQLAKEGMKFTDAHTSSSVCTPTRYGILTGRYNWRSTLKAGVLWGRSKALIPKERETAASLLKKADYHTAFIGKWHLGWNWNMDENEVIDFSKPVLHNPNDVGFDYAYGHAASLDIPPYVYVENGNVTAIPTEKTENKDYQGFWRDGFTAPDFVHEEVTPHFFEKSYTYIKEQAQTENPFFLYLALPSPHTPILPVGEWQGKSGLNPYADFVMMVDDYMGKLNQAVKDAGIEDNTIIIFTSDNGCSPRAKFEELGEKGHDPSYVYRGHKADIYEGGHRVPFIVKWPQTIKGDTESNATICTTDFLATCAAITQLPLADNAGEDSYNMMPLFEQNSGFERTSTIHHSVDGEFAIRQGNWKLIMCPGSGGWSYPRKKDLENLDIPSYQLFNLKDDPTEESNLIEANESKAKELQALLEEIIQNGRSTAGPSQQNDQVDEWKQISWMSSNP